VLGLFSQRLLTVLQLTRMALVFTAIADSLMSLLLWARSQVGPGENVRAIITAPHVMSVALMSIGLYGFGMSLNDIIDRRRDLTIAAHRPLPSGRIGIAAAHVVCALLAICSVIGGLLVMRFAGPLSFVLLVFTGLLITFYDFAGKYLVTPGLLTLGLIRFFHATVAAPRLPLVWHPLVLMNHVAIISALAYKWESKRPALKRRDWFKVFGGLAVLDAMCVSLVAWRRLQPTGGGLAEALWITRGLALPVVAVGGFALLALAIRLIAGDNRRAGQTLMLYGLLWLIVYDAAFTAGYVSPLAAMMILLLLPMAYLSVQVMRWWGKVLSLSQKPEFQRVR
jgi:4-hydroxybenzoate polyprenyltransferase